MEKLKPFVPQEPSISAGSGRFWQGLDYTAWVFLIGLACVTVAAYFIASSMAGMLFIVGLFCLGHLWGRPLPILTFAPVAALTAVILLLGFVRSDFVMAVMRGTPLGTAWAASKHYFLAPMVMWFTTWAFVMAGVRLNETRSARVFQWFAWLMLGLAGVQVLDALGGMALRNWINVTFFSRLRPEMNVVRFSDTNAVQLLMFWPLCFYFMQRRQVAQIALLVITLLAVAVVADTNAHILALVASCLVFFAARYWPRGLSGRGITPERVLAVSSAAFILIFPVVIAAIVRAGNAAQVKAHLPASWSVRIDIWTFAVEKALQKPLWGWGYESSRLFDPMIPNHPHNMSLQAWMELGVPGLVLLAGLWFSIFWFMAPKGDYLAPAHGLKELHAIDDARAPESEISPAQTARPYMLALASTYFVINSISYGLWRDWLYALGALAATLSIVAIKAISARNKLQS